MVVCVYMGMGVLTVPRYTAIPNFDGTSTAEVTVLYGTIYKRLKVYLCIGLPIHCNHQLAHYTGFCARQRML